MKVAVGFGTCWIVGSATVTAFHLSIEDWIFANLMGGIMLGALLSALVSLTTNVYFNTKDEAEWEKRKEEEERYKEFEKLVKEGKYD